MYQGSKGGRVRGRGAGVGWPYSTLSPFLHSKFHFLFDCAQQILCLARHLVPSTPHLSPSVSSSSMLLYESIAPATASGDPAQSNASRSLSRLFVLSRVFMAYASLALRSSFTTESRIVYIPRYTLCKCVCVWVCGCVWGCIGELVTVCKQHIRTGQAKDLRKCLLIWNEWSEGGMQGKGKGGGSWEASCIH